MFRYQLQKERDTFLLCDIFFLLRKPRGVSPLVFSSSHLLIDFPFPSHLGGVGPLVIARLWFCHSLPFQVVITSSNYKPFDLAASAVRTPGVSVCSPRGTLSRRKWTCAFGTTHVVGVVVIVIIIIIRATPVEVALQGGLKWFVNLN